MRIFFIAVVKTPKHYFNNKMLRLGLDNDHCGGKKQNNNLKQ